MMVIGNFALLADNAPRQIERWYLSVYAYAFEWVEMPNTLGMAVFAGSGQIASKLYVASGANIDRMSDFCAGCTYDVRRGTARTPGRSEIALNAACEDARPTRSIMFSKPEFTEPGTDQESVWDYPRPPRLEKVSDKLRVTFAGETIAETDHGYRVLETSHPPVYYFPPSDVKHSCLAAAPGRTFCEFKGIARYWTLDVGGRRAEKAAWSYPEPTERFQAIRDFFAFYASRVDCCWVGKERVEAQTGDFYGGWITSRIVGPFKGPPGTLDW